MYKMKIAILTYPIHSNFGFIMQAYALQVHIRKLGHVPVTINVQPQKVRTINKIKQTIKDFINTFKGKDNSCFFRSWPTYQQQQFMDQNTNMFVKEYLSLTLPVSSKQDFFREDIQSFDSYIVGSDQVWRYAYINDITTYFFDFFPDDKPRMSYAASFGISDFDYSKKSENQCRNLISKFDIVSVREFDGVKICKDKFGVNAIKVIDPVFLLDKMEYSSLAQKGKKLSLKKYLFSYILDVNEEKRQFVKDLSCQLGLEVVNLLPEKFYMRGSENIEQCIYPPICDLLRGFMECEYVVTDSFHGTAFSIIFNKKFTVFSNNYRGNSRLNSILSTFSLESRLYSKFHDINEKIQYDNVNNLIKEQRHFSSKVLEKFFTSNN